MRVYRESFDDGPRGWFGYTNNTHGPKPLEIHDNCTVSSSPWWVDHNHALPGFGYLHLLYVLLTRGAPGEHEREASVAYRFIAGGFGTNFKNAWITLRLKGEWLNRGARRYLL